MSITTVTAMEYKVLNFLRSAAQDEPFSWPREISAGTNLDIRTITGLIGSLVKKQLVMTDEHDGREIVGATVYFSGDSEHGSMAGYLCDYDPEAYHWPAIHAV